MSVVKSKRSEAKLDVIKVAEEIGKYILTITSNENTFKPSHIELTKRIIDCAIDIPCSLIEANKIWVTDVDSLRDRINLQTHAHREIKRLTNMMKYAQSIFHFRSKRTKYVVKLGLQCQDLITKWKKSDIARYREKIKK